MKATGWGMKSIKQIMPLVIPSTVQQGRDFDDLDLVYSRLISQWAQELRHVAIVVGGTSAQEKYGGQNGARYAAESRARQKEAVQVPERERVRDADASSSTPTSCAGSRSKARSAASTQRRRA